MRALKGSIVKEVFAGSGIRLIGLPLIGGLGLVNTALIVGVTGELMYGVVSLVATLGALLPFADLGVGGVVTTAIARADESRSSKDQAAEAVRSAYRLLSLVGVGIAGMVFLIGLLNFWDLLLGQSFSHTENMIISACLIIFGLTVPLGLGVRILTGFRRNDLAVLISMTSPAFALVMTGVMLLLRADDLYFAASTFLGILISNIIGTLVASAWLGRSGMRVTLLNIWRSRRSTRRGLLAGSGWLFAVTIGLPIGLQGGRLILSHLSDLVSLSQYALMFQIYALAWSVVSTSGGALWAFFARQRNDCTGSYEVWRWMVVLYGFCGVLAGSALALLGPLLGSLLSRGVITIPSEVAAAFGCILLAQCLHLPAGSLLTLPHELRWQAFCVCAMALLSLSLGVGLVPFLGGAGIAFGAAAAILVTQFLPDTLMVKRFLSTERGSTPSTVLARNVR